MILKFDSSDDETYKQDIFYIEATGGQGVKIRKWQNIKENISTFYERVVLRHLNFERSDESLKKLENFLKQVHGLKYGLKAK